VLNARNLTSVCRYLSNQKHPVDEAYWQHLDTESSLRTGLLRSLFCCLRIEGADQTQLLARVVDHARLNLQAQLLMPDVIKYRALDADLVQSQRWSQDKKEPTEATAKLSIFKHYPVHEGIVQVRANGQKF